MPSLSFVLWCLRSSFAAASNERRFQCQLAARDNGRRLNLQCALQSRLGQISSSSTKITSVGRRIPHQSTQGGPSFLKGSSLAICRKKTEPPRPPGKDRCKHASTV